MIALDILLMELNSTHLDHDSVHVVTAESCCVYLRKAQGMQRIHESRSCQVDVDEEWLRCVVNFGFHCRLLLRLHISFTAFESVQQASRVTEILTTRIYIARAFVDLCHLTSPCCRNDREEPYDQAQQ